MRAECDNPEIFMLSDTWPEDIYYRWYKPDKLKMDGARREAKPQDDASATPASQSSTNNDEQESATKDPNDRDDSNVGIAV